MIKILVVMLFAIASLWSPTASAASASFAATLGSGASFAAWCVGGTGGTCSGGVFWPSTVIANSSGTEIFTTANPGYFDIPSATPASTNLGQVLAAPPNLTYQATWGSACSYSSGNNAWCGDPKGAAWMDIGAINGAAYSVSNPGFTEITDGTNGAAAVKAASTATAAADKALVVGLSPNSATPARLSDYPFGSTPLTASATGTTAATTATLTNVSGSYTFICGFSIRANATAAITGNATVTGTISGTLNFTQWTAPLASGLGVTEEVFSPCIEASAVSTSIAVVSAAPGSGGTVSVTAWGYTKLTSP